MVINTKLIHPEIIAELAATGHGGKVLITDSNYAFSTNANPAAKRIYLNLMPGRLTVTEVLEAIVASSPIEAVDVMQSEDVDRPDIWQEFNTLLPGHELTINDRFAFYKKAHDPNVCMVIATGDTRLSANILLTVGFIP